MRLSLVSINRTTVVAGCALICLLLAAPMVAKGGGGGSPSCSTLTHVNTTVQYYQTGSTQNCGGALPPYATFEAKWEHYQDGSGNWYHYKDFDGPPQTGCMKQDIGESVFSPLCTIP